MSFELSANELKTRDQLLADLQRVTTALEDATNDYNTVVDDIDTYVSSVRDRLQEEFDEKSEKWQEGDKGSAASTLIEEWSSMDVGHVEVDLPIYEALENLPTASEE